MSTTMNIKMTVNGAVEHNFNSVETLLTFYVTVALRPTDKVRVTVNGKVARVEVYKGKATITVF